MDYHYPEEKVFDGVTYDSGIDTKDLTYIRDELVLKTDDIVVATYPKAGTTWMQEIVWTLYHGKGAADRRSKSFDEIFPFLEFNLDGLNGLELIKALPGPRFIKTHLQARFYKRQLEGGSPCPKFIVVYRNPKDVLVSYFRFHKIFQDPYKFPGSWNEFFELAKEKRVMFGDYYEHLLGWWEYRDHSNVLFVKYEDLKRDTKTTINCVANFLRVPASDELLDAVVEDTSFAKMQARPMELYSPMLKQSFEQGENFFWKGKIDSWRDILTEDQIQQINEQVAQKLHTVGIRFN